MAKNAKRKASAPPMGYNARKKKSKHRPLTQKEKRLILIGIGVLVLAAILFAIFYDDGSLPMRGEDVVTEGAQQMLSYAIDPETGERAAEPSESEVAVLNTNWLITNFGSSSKPKYYKLAEISVPDGFYRRQDTNKSNQETDFWFYPEDESTGTVNFVYFSGSTEKYHEIPNDTSAMVSAYNESCEVSEVFNGPIGGKDAYYYYYSASNTNQETGVVEYSQSFNCYFQGPRDSTIVMLLTVSGDSEDIYLSEEELLAQAEIFAACIHLDEEA